MRKLVISTNLIVFLGSLVLELMGIGLIARWRTHELYSFVSVTGHGTMITFLYSVFFLLLPFVNFVALISKDRGFLIEESKR